MTANARTVVRNEIAVNTGVRSCSNILLMTTLSCLLLKV
jgi:hypothetical protein